MKKKNEVQAEQDYEQAYCVLCHSPYVDFTEEVEKWIQCDNCDRWTHYSCVGILDNDQPTNAYLVNFAMKQLDPLPQLFHTYMLSILFPLCAIPQMLTLFISLDSIPTCV